MTLQPTGIPDVSVITLHRFDDDRGSLVKSWDKCAFEALGLEIDLAQGYLSRSKYAGTLRGFHYQVEPAPEMKLIQCIRGAIYEVVIDVRPDSCTFGQWQAFKFSPEQHRMLLVPDHCAHAVLTLEDDTEYLNWSNAPYVKEAERGIRYDDPFFNIVWPREIKRASNKDLAWEDFNDRRR